MAREHSYTDTREIGFRYLRYQYWTFNNSFSDRVQIVMSMDNGEEALCFFNASRTSPRKTTSDGKKFYPRRHSKIMRWWEEVAKFELPRSTGELCNGFKKRMSQQFFSGHIVEKRNIFGDVLNVIDLLTLKPLEHAPAKNGWKQFEIHPKNFGANFEISSKQQWENDESIPF